MPALFIGFRCENTLWLCISGSTTMPVQNVVNPTFRERVSISLRCIQLGFVAGSSMNNAVLMRRPRTKAEKGLP